MKLSLEGSCRCVSRLQKIVYLRGFLALMRHRRGKWALTLSGDEAWVHQYEAIWFRINEFLHAPGCGGFELGETLTGEPLSNGKYVNAKLITWDNEIKTRFRGNYPGYIEDIGACHATGVLKIGSVYRQGSNYHFQVFLKECKYQKRDVSFESQLSDDESDDDGNGAAY